VKLQRLIPILILVVGFSTSCDLGFFPSNKIEKDILPIKEMEVFKIQEQSFGGDIRMTFSGIDFNDTGRVYRVRALYKDSIIGFDLVKPDKKSGVLKFKSIGTKSDLFLQALYDAYKIPMLNSPNFIDEINIDYINIGQYIDSLISISKGSYYAGTKAQYKIFLQGQHEEDYGELYLNIGEDDNWIELEEKHEEYRIPILRILNKLNDNPQ
jgi:hypothetical protein